MGTGGWKKGVNSSDLGSLVISVCGCVGLPWFAVRTKNLLEEEKRGRGNGGSENTGGFSYIWLFEQINCFVDLHCPYSVLLNHFLRKHFNELSQNIFY